MGQSNTLVCKKCGYSIGYREGIGMLHPHTCQRILQGMKEGKEGEVFQKYANELKNPAINTEYALFRCRSCNELKSDRILEICEQVAEYPQDRSYGWRGVDKMENFPMALSGVHKAVYSLPHPCKCGKEMKPVKRYHALPCPRCGTVLIKEPFKSMFWD